MDFNYEKIVPPRIDAPSSELDSIRLGRTASNDLLRRKLEAELRAAEAIGKLKQSIIEKRLALELAAIEDEHRRRKGGGGGGGGGGGVHYAPASNPPRQHENPVTSSIDPRNIFRRTSLWPKKASNHRSPHRIDSFYKDGRHEGQGAYREGARSATLKESSHKHLRSALSKSGASAYEPRGSRMRRDSPYAHSTRSMEEDDDTLEEQGNEEEVAVADPSLSADNTIPVETMRGKKSNVKEFFKKLGKKPPGVQPPG